MVHQYNNSGEMDKFLERHKLPKLTLEETENLNIPITSKEIELVTRKLPSKKSPGSDGFIGEPSQTFKWLIPVLHKFFQNIENTHKLILRDQYHSETKTLHEKETIERYLLWIHMQKSLTKCGTSRFNGCRPFLGSGDFKWNGAEWRQSRHRPVDVNKRSVPAAYFWSQKHPQTSK